MGKGRYTFPEPSCHLCGKFKSVGALFSETRYCIQNLADAETYLKTLQLHEKWRTEKKIIVSDRPSLARNKWYTANMEIIRLMNEMGISPYDDGFIPSVPVHLDALRKRFEQLKKESAA